MAVGDLTLSSGFTLTPEDLRAIAAESKKILAEESKDLSQFKEIDSISSVSSLPGISAKEELVRVPMAILKGLDGREIELASSSTDIQWRYVGNPGWNVLVELSLLTGPKGTPGDPPVVSIGTVSTLPFNSSATAGFVLRGETPEGVPIYALDLGIPQGKPGQDGNGAGNVFVPTDNIIADRYYIFKSSVDKSANGDFIELDSLAFGVGQNYSGYKNAEIFNDYENNKAAGNYAHAEGMNTNATGPRAHAEGYKTNVFASEGHAEGRGTWCLGAQSHVEGLYSYCLGDGSHVEGGSIGTQPYFIENTVGGIEDRPIFDTEGEALRTFIEDYGTYNSENIEHSLSFDAVSLLERFALNMSIGSRSHLEGCNNFICDNTSHVEGYNNICGDLYYSHSAPIVHKANHVEGYNNVLFSGRKYIDQNFCVHIEGYNNKVHRGCSFSHIGGKDCVMSEGSSSSFCHGDHLLIESSYGVSFGRYNEPILNGEKVLFSYGIGNGPNNRKNALSILEDGTVSIPSIEDKINNSIDSNFLYLNDKLNDNNKELRAIMDEQSNQIRDLLELLQSGIEGVKAFIAGSVLVFTNNIKTEVLKDILFISDSQVVAENEVLIIK